MIKKYICFLILRKKWQISELFEFDRFPNKQIGHICKQKYISTDKLLTGIIQGKK